MAGKEIPGTGIGLPIGTTAECSPGGGRWRGYNQRGPVDLNFLFSDGSVRCIRQIPYRAAGRTDVLEVNGWENYNQAWETPLPPD